MIKVDFSTAHQRHSTARQTNTEVQCRGAQWTIYNFTFRISLSLSLAETKLRIKTKLNPKSKVTQSLPV